MEGNYRDQVQLLDHIRAEWNLKHIIKSIEYYPNMTANGKKKYSLLDIGFNIVTIPSELVFLYW